MDGEIKNSDCCELYGAYACRQLLSYNACAGLGSRLGRRLGAIAAVIMAADGVIAPTAMARGSREPLLVRPLWVQPSQILISVTIITPVMINGGISSGTLLALVPVINLA